MPDVFSNEHLDCALNMFFSNSTVPYDEWNEELKQSYRNDMKTALVYLYLAMNSVDNPKSDV